MGGSNTGGFRRGVVICTAEATETLVLRNTVAALAVVCEHVTALVPVGCTALGDVHSSLRIVRVPPVPGLDRARPASPDEQHDGVVWGPVTDALARIRSIDEQAAALRGDRQRPRRRLVLPRRRPRRRLGLPRRRPLEQRALDVNFAPALVRADPDVVLALDPGALAVARSVRRRARATFRLEYVPEPLNLPLRLKGEAVDRHSLRRKAKLAEHLTVMVCHAPRERAGGMIDALRAHPDLHAVVLAHDVGPWLRHLKAAASAATVRDRLHPVIAPDFDVLPAFLRDADLGVQFGAGEPETMRAVAVAGRPVVRGDGAQAIRRALGIASPPPRWEDETRRLLERIGPQRPGPRLLIGPRNGNGQAAAWAGALRTAAPGVVAKSFAVEFPGLAFNDAVDHLIPLRSWKSARWAPIWARYALAGFTHVLLERGLTLLGRLNGTRFFSDLETLAEHGVTPGLVFRGSEIRDPRRHAERERWSPFRTGDSLTARLQQSVDGLAPHVAAFAGRTFVTTLDMLDDLPDATWLPQVVELGAPGDVPLTRRRPVVLHAPTNAQLKGSDAVDAACRPLAEAGAIEYRRVSGVPHPELVAMIRSADIVLDQFALGCYAMTAVEAMAAGRPVVGHVADRVRARIPGDLPIVQATPVDLRDVLTRLLDSPAEARAAAAAGRAYVERFHDGRHSGAVLAEFVNTST